MMDCRFAVVFFLCSLAATSGIALDMKDPWQNDCLEISGKVVDRETGEAVPSVIVELNRESAAVTNAGGFFSVCAPSEDPVTLSFRLDGKEQSLRELVAVSGEQLTVEVDLGPMPEFSDEMTVTGDGVAAAEPVRRVKPVEVKALPGAGEDVLQTLRVLPGVLSGDDWSSRLYVRGGRPDQNGIYIDGISVFDPYRLFGLTSLFNPETVGSIAMYPGGFDVRYGDRLSAVVEVENRDGRMDRAFAGVASVAMTHTNLVAEGRLSEQWKSSWIVSARRTYYDLAIKASGDSDSSFPAFTDAQARISFEPAKGHRFSITMLGYDEGTDLIEEEEPTFGDVDDQIAVLDDQRGAIAGLHGEHHLGEKLRLDYWLSATTNEQSSDFAFEEGETGFGTTYVQALEGEVASLRTILEAYLGRHTLLAGGEFAHSTNDVTFRFRTEDPRIPVPPWLEDFSETEDFDRTSAFLQDSWQATPKLTLKAGVRWDRSTLSDVSTTSPRALARYQFNPAWDFRFAWGEYSQFASYEALQGDGYFLDLRGIKELKLEPEKAQHWVLSAGHTNPRGWRLGVDLYHKDLDDILQSGEYVEEILVLNDDDVAVPYIRDQPSFIPENARSGYARGAELTFTVLEKPSRPFYGMLSYAFAQAKTRDDEGWLWEPWDRRHTLTLMGGWKFKPRWELGWRWRFATGFPYTPLTNVIRVVEDVDGDGIYDPEVGDFITYQRDEPHEVERSERLPLYHRLDLRLQYSRTYSRVQTSYYLDLINAYGQENAFGYQYNADLTEREIVEGMPFLPSVGVKVVF